MERWIRASKCFNKVLGVGALVLLTAIPLVLVGSAMASADGETSPVMDSATPMDSGTPVDSVVLTAEGNATVRCWAFLAAALATGLGSLAAGYAVGNVGTAAMGAVAEKPELMGKSLIYVALAEGIAIYGLLISIIVLSKV